MFSREKRKVTGVRGKLKPNDLARLQSDSALFQSFLTGKGEQLPRKTRRRIVTRSSADRAREIMNQPLPGSKTRPSISRKANMEGLRPTQPKDKVDIAARLEESQQLRRFVRRGSMEDIARELQPNPSPNTGEVAKKPTLDHLLGFSSSSQLRQKTSDAKTQQRMLLAVQRNYQAVTLCLQSKAKELAAEQVEKRDLAGRLQETVIELRTTQKALTESQKAEEENRTIAAKLQVHEKENIDRAAELREVKAELIDLLGWKKDLLADLTTTRRELNREKGTTLKLQQELQAQNKDEEVAAIEDKLGATVHELARVDALLVQEQRKVTEIALRLSQTANMLQQKTLDIQSLELSTNRMRELLELAKQERTEAEEALATERTRAERRLSLHANNLQLEKSTKSTLQMQFDAVWAEKEHLETEKQQLLESLESERAGRASTVSELEKLQQQLTTLSAVSNTARMLQEEAKHMLSENGKLLEAKHALEERIQELTAESAHSENSWKSQHDDARAAQESLQAQLRAVQDKSVSVEVLQGQLAEAQAANQVLKQQLQALQTELETKPDPALLESEREAIRTETAALYQEKLRGFETTVQALNTQLNEAAEEKAELLTLLGHNTAAFKDSKSNRDAMQRRERELQAVLAKLLISETSSQTSFTCGMCLDLFRSPVTCIPCGHSYCKQCLEEKGYCSAPSCGQSKKISFYSNDMLDELKNRYTFRQQALSGLIELNKQRSTSRAAS